ncbi:MAG: hypothetical protein VKM17_03350 [Cyanobacteriota bacterium]|nr:hypothetical protein [Cyanobacteriota bacterium]
MARSRPPSNRFLPTPEEQTPRAASPSRNSSGKASGLPRGSQDIFAEGQWQSIRVALERQGWSASQIERVQDQLRQGWPLSVAKQNVANLTRHCPLGSRSPEG